MMCPDCGHAMRVHDDSGCWIEGCPCTEAWAEHTFLKGLTVPPNVYVEKFQRDGAWNTYSIWMTVGRTRHTLATVRVHDYGYVKVRAEYGIPTVSQRRAWDALVCSVTGVHVLDGMVRELEIVPT